MVPDDALSTKRAAIVLEHMQAENSHDFERCIAAFAHPRYEIVATGEVYDGAGQVASLLGENLSAFPDFRFAHHAMHHADEAVVVEGRFTGTHEGTWRGLPATGRPVDVPMVLVFEFEEDAMVCERAYFDLGTALQQLGVARDPNTTGGRIAAAINHPLTVGKALLRRFRPMPAEGEHPGAPLGLELHNPLSGERIIFRDTAASSGGELFRVEIFMPPGPFVVPPHVHPANTERFVVLEGKIGAHVGQALHIASPGEVIDVPIAVAHDYWNAGSGDLHIYAEHRPAHRSAEIFFLTYHGLAREGKLSPSGQMNPFQAGVLAQQVGDFIRPVWPPPALQDPLFSALAAAGRRLGYRAWYPRHLPPAS